MSNTQPEPNEQELEAIVNRRLRAMPHRKAPATLSSRTMAAIQARHSLAWWHKPIGCWSLPARVVIVAAMLVSAAAVTSATSWMVQKGMPWVEAGWSHALQAWEGMETLGHAASTVLRSGLQPWICALLGVSFLMWLLCLGAGTAIVRVAYKK